MTDHNLPQPSRDVPQGPPGAGWVLAGFLVFAAVVFTGWAEGWWSTSNTATAPAPSHHSTTGTGSAKTQ